MVDSGHSVIGCYCDGHGVAAILVEILNERDYRILEDWYQTTASGLETIVHKCSKFSYQEIRKRNQKVEVFINGLGSLELLLSEALQPYSIPVKIVSVEKEEAFTLVSSLIAEDRLLVTPQISGLERDLKSFDPFATYPNHRVHALLNAVGQAEFNRITVPKRHHSVKVHVKSRRASCPSIFPAEWDD